MRKLFLSLALALGLVAPAIGAGSIPIALTQQFNANGQPLIGCQLFLYVTGTVATPQNAFQDTGLTLPLPWPVTCDSNGRLPMFYLADGTIHARLTDSAGVVQFDYASMLVIGPSSGGGGGSTVDPTTIAATGDIKFRAAGETLSGWVRVNGRTIGSATSGATERANADTQSLFSYLWQNCTDAHCPVIGGRGGSAAADFAANKQITLPDWRSRIPVGLDDMGNSAAGRMLSSNVTSGGGDGVTTPGATGGEANHTLAVSEMPSHNHGVTDPAHTHGPGNGGGQFFESGAGGGAALTGGNTVIGSNTTAASATGISINNTGGGGAHNVMQPFMLGTWFIKL